MKKKFKKKGFTLIELLASIAILAILTIVIVPKVTSLINNSTRAINKEKIQGVIKSASSYFTEFGDEVEKFNGVTNVFDNLEYTGDLHDFVQKNVYINDIGKVSVSFRDKDTCYFKDFDMNNIEMGEYDGSRDCLIQGLAMPNECFATTITGTGTANITGYKCYDPDAPIPQENITGITTRIVKEVLTGQEPIVDVIIPSTLDIGGKSYSVTGIGDYAFAGVNLNSIKFHGSNLTTIGKGAFAQNSLTTVKIPSSVSLMGTGAFLYNNIKKLSIGTSLLTIPESAFAYNKIETLTLPEGATIIGEMAFANNKISTLNFSSTVTTIGESSFIYNNIQTLNVPRNVSIIQKMAFAYNDLREFNFDGSNIIFGDTALFKFDPIITSTGKSNTNFTKINVPNLTYANIIDWGKAIDGVSSSKTICPPYVGSCNVAGVQIKMN